MAASYDPAFVEDAVPINDNIVRRARVRSITGHTTAIASGTPSAGSFRSHYLEYDRAGIRILNERFDHQGRLAQRWAYDARGRLSQETLYDATGRKAYWVDVTHDDQGWLEKAVCSSPGRLSYRVAATRDATGRLLQTTFYDPAGHQIRTESYRYDATGLLVRVAVGNMGERIYQYDQRRNLKRRLNNLPGMSAYGDVQEFAYDDRDLLIRMEHLHFSVTMFAFAS